MKIAADKVKEDIAISESTLTSQIDAKEQKIMMNLQQVLGEQIRTESTLMKKWTLKQIETKIKESEKEGQFKLERRVKQMQELFNVDILIGPMCQFENYGEFVKHQVQFGQQTKQNFYQAKQDQETTTLKILEGLGVVEENRKTQCEVNEALVLKIEQAQGYLEE